MTQSSPQRATRRSVILETLQTIVQAALVFLILTALLGRFVVHQTSMEPNFHEGQRVVVSKIGSLWTDLFVTTAHAAGQPSRTPAIFHRGQIAVFYDNPEHSGDPLIKRVIGAPGDRIELRNGAVWVNGKQIEEAYLNGATTSCLTTCGPITLAEDEYYMMGDNRAVSRDSRSFGPVKADRFVGRVVLRYWPLDQLAFFP